jgi:hypothetical protein
MIFPGNTAIIPRHDPPRKTEARMTSIKDLPQGDHLDPQRDPPPRNNYARMISAKQSCPGRLRMISATIIPRNTAMIPKHDPPRKTGARMTLAKDLAQENYFDPQT